jgi:DNA-binding NarL/FixJ family response regulator
MTKALVAGVDDLFFRSKIEATARHLSVPIRFAASGDLPREARASDVAAVLLELSANGAALDAVEKIRAEKSTSSLPIVGFLSHVDQELRRRAEAAGVTRVLARSEFSETLPDLVMDLLAPGTKREIQEEPELPDE